MELAEEIPEGLTKELSLHLLKEKEERLTSVYQQLQSIQMQESSGVDFDSTILLNRTMFDDKMFIKTGYSGQDLQRAIVKYGIYKQRMDEAKKLEEEQQN